MMSYDELVELAGLCSRNSRITTSKEVATELWRMARSIRPKPPSLACSPKLVTSLRCKTGAAKQWPRPWQFRSR